MDLTMFYNHKKMVESVKSGEKIVNDTDFSKYENQRLNAIKKFSLGDIIEDNGMRAIITGINNDCIIAIPLGWYNKAGKLKKQYENKGGYFFNPCHVKIVKEAI